MWVIERFMKETLQEEKLYFKAYISHEVKEHKN